MKKQHLRRFKILIFLCIFGFSVFAAGYLYFDSLLNKTAVSNQQESVPYYIAKPQNTTVLLQICYTQILFHLDFEQEILNVIYLNEPAEQNSEVFGYKVEHIIKGDYSLVGYLVDMVEGIELSIDGQTLRYTGVQILDMLKFTDIADSHSRDITTALIKGIGQTGFTKENLLYIIKNSNTNLNFRECFVWVGYLQKLCQFSRFVN